MKRQALQLTMRELRQAVRSPLLWAALAAAAVTLGLAGPFGTYEALPLPGRLAYWAFVSVTTYLTAYGATTFLHALSGRPARTPVRDGLYGAASGVLVTALVWLVNRWVFDAGGIGLLPLLGYVVAVSALASFTVSLFSSRLTALPTDTDRAASAPPLRPPLLDRLPPQMRGRLRYLSMHDHYVEVVTEKGRHLLLMRLSDAMSETTGIEGLRIHRSHWVALDAVTGAERRGDQAVLMMADGTELPVSRAKMKDVREAGFL